MTSTTARARRPRGVTEGGQFATEPRSESAVTLTAPARPDPYGGFRLSEVCSEVGERGWALRASLTEHGRPVAHVERAADGSPATVTFLDDDARARFADQAAALAARASTLKGSARRSHQQQTRLATDALVSRLVVVSAMDSRSRPAFVLDGDDFWGQHQYREMSSRATTEDLTRYLTQPDIAAQNPRVWDRGAGDFIPFADWAPPA